MFFMSREALFAPSLETPCARVEDSSRLRFIPLCFVVSLAVPGSACEADSNGRSILPVFPCFFFRSLLTTVPPFSGAAEHTLGEVSGIEGVIALRSIGIGTVPSSVRRRLVDRSSSSGDFLRRECFDSLGCARCNDFFDSAENGWERLASCRLLCLFDGGTSWGFRHTTGRTAEDSVVGALVTSLSTCITSEEAAGGMLRRPTLIT